MDQSQYEALYIVPGSLTSDEIAAVAEKFKGIVEKNGGTVSKAELWEKRKLAYEIGSHRDGNYIIMQFAAPPAAPAELNRLMRIDDTVIRHTIGVRTEAELAAAAAQKAVAEEA